MPIKQMEGECSGCGVCCCSDAYFIEEKGVAAWFEMHGFKAPIGCEEFATILVKKINPDKMKFIFFNKCIMLTRDKTCSIYDSRPSKCKNFPTSIEASKCIPECSFNK